MTSESPGRDAEDEPEVSSDASDESPAAGESAAIDPAEGVAEPSGDAEPEGEAGEAAEAAPPAEAGTPAVPEAPVQNVPPAAYGAWQYPRPIQPPPLFDDFWPEPDKSRAPVALLAAVLGGAGAAVFLPIGRPGIGWPLLGLTIAAGLFLVARKAEKKVHIGRYCWGATAVLLLSVCAFRASEWLAALCILTACLAGMLAVAGGSTVRAHAMSVAAIPLAAFRALPWVVSGTSEMRRTSGGMRIAVSLAASVVLLLIFGGLFASADDNFAALVSAVMPDLDVETFFRWTFVFAFFAAACLGAAFTAVRPPELSVAQRGGKTLRRWEWALPVGALVALFAAFIVVQSPPMFGGQQQVASTAELTFAVYARSGFWQLMMVTILTLPIIGGAARWAPKDTRFDRNLLRGLVGVLAVLTLMIVASALVRMWVYQDAYGFTVLRVLVQSCELWLGVVYVLIIAAGVRLRARWLPTAILGTAMAALLILALINPEGLIAERNIARYEATRKLDSLYLGGLSADAAPAVEKLPAHESGAILRSIRSHSVAEGWRSWNLDRAQVLEP